MARMTTAVVVAATLLLLLSAAAPALAQTAKPQDTEQWTPVPAAVTPGASDAAPPSDAVVLFDGTSLDAWVSTRDGKPAKVDIKLDPIGRFSDRPTRQERSQPMARADRTVSPLIGPHACASAIAAVKPSAADLNERILPPWRR